MSWKVEADRIRLVTRRYAEMQGLGRCAIGAGLIAGSIAGDAVLGKDEAWWAFLVPLLVAASIAVPGKLASDRLYERRFGRVRAGDDPERGARLGLLMGAGFAIVAILEEKFAGPGYPSAWFLFLAASAARTVPEDWPYRWYLLLEVLAAVTASLLYMTVEPPAAREALAAVRYAFWWQGFGLLGTAAVVTGMLDHRFLARTLHERPRTDLAEEHAGPI